MRYQTSSADLKNENKKAVKAAGDASYREAFLAESSEHILRLAAKISGRILTKSDDEWSIALMATSEALDHYDEEKGDFWSYAAVVIKSRLFNLYRSNKRSEGEISVSPSVFEGEVEEDDPELSMKLELQDRMVSEDTAENSSLKEEILALTEWSPRSRKTQQGCAEVIASFFLPPPLVELMRERGFLPAKELKERSGQTVKFLDKFRKYLITSALILDGDYPGLSE